MYPMLLHMLNSQKELCLVVPVLVEVSNQIFGMGCQMNIVVVFEKDDRLGDTLSVRAKAKHIKERFVFPLCPVSVD